ncbi:SCO family protein [Sphingomonas arantia]|uniref:SCO family protein n=1 Tax=Sphingomonas arantia TaxID=1460676 RepID=A0ABW4TTZ2_9SPHN
MNKTHLLAAPVLAFCLALGGCGSKPVEEPPLAGATIGGAFALTDQDGRAVTEASYAGKYRVMYFGYTYCPDVCPLDVQRLMAGYRAFAKADPVRATKVQPIFVSVDPARDTPTVVKQFVGAFGAPLVGLTGTDAQIAAVAKRYAVIYSKEAGPKPDAYLMNHSRMAMLFAPDGKPVALLRADESADAVAADLDRWVA